MGPWTMNLEDLDESTPSGPSRAASQLQSGARRSSCPRSPKRARRLSIPRTRCPSLPPKTRNFSETDLTFPVPLGDRSFRLSDKQAGTKVLLLEALQAGKWDQILLAQVDPALLVEPSVGVSPTSLAEGATRQGLCPGPTSQIGECPMVALADAVGSSPPQ